MATSSSRRYDDVGVNGWQAFAGVILFLNGVFGFLYGLAASDLKAEELAAHDRLYEVIVGLRAVKRGG